MNNTLKLILHCANSGSQKNQTDYSKRPITIKSCALVTLERSQCISFSPSFFSLTLHRSRTCIARALVETFTGIHSDKHSDNDEACQSTCFNKNKYRHACTDASTVRYSQRREVKRRRQTTRARLSLLQQLCTHNSIEKMLLRVTDTVICVICASYFLVAFDVICFLSVNCFE